MFPGDRVNPDWPPPVVEFQAGLKKARRPYDYDFIECHYKLWLAGITAAQSGVVVNPITVRLTEETSIVQDNRLAGKIPVLVYIGNQPYTYDFTDVEVYDPATGTHYLGDTWGANTEIYYVVKPKL